VVIADDAIGRLAERVRHEALAVMDANTQEAAGSRVVAELYNAEPLVFEQRSGLAATPDAVERVSSRIGERVPVAVGAGVITDVVRRAASCAQRDFISVPTAASMDGYASSVAALHVDGVKVTVPARSPRAIFADPRVAAHAPLELTRSGIGDLLAKTTARVDWLAAHLLYGEPFSAAVEGRIAGVLNSVASSVEPVLAGDVAAVAQLLRGLIDSGLAIAAVGNSRPASRCEHHASHFWDLLAARGTRPHHSHGLQVGYATWFAMRLQRFAFGGGVSTLRRPRPPFDPLGPAARRWLGDPSPYILAAVEEKRRFAAQLERWPGDEAAWMSVRAALRPALEPFARVERALAGAGIPDVPGFLDVDETTLRATFRYASRLRARYTVIDFLEGQGALDEAIDAALRPPG
jgi:glycerol-1-phosphate dehydrogenase [NAD(P)+]